MKESNFLRFEYRQTKLSADVINKLPLNWLIWYINNFDDSGSTVVDSIPSCFVWNHQSHGCFFYDILSCLNTTVVFIPQYLHLGCGTSVQLFMLAILFCFFGSSLAIKFSGSVCVQHILNIAALPTNSKNPLKYGKGSDIFRCSFQIRFSFRLDSILDTKRKIASKDGDQRTGTKKSCHCFLFFFFSERKKVSKWLCVLRKPQKN